MKNLLFKSVLLLTCIPVLFSCSGSEKVTANKGPQYTYRKVYEGNRILYRDLEDKAKTESHTPENTYATNSERKKRPLRAAEKKYTVERASVDPVVQEHPEKQSLVHTFASNYRQIHSSLITGDFLTKIKTPAHITSTSREDDHTNAMSSGDIFAILGFVFGVAGFVGSGVGIAASVLGLVFSILGLNSSLRIFALIGLIVSVVSLIFAIV